MRSDIQKLICEKERGGSSNRSFKTGLKLNPNLEYDSDEIDWGPNYLSSARGRQYGYESKRLSENLNPLEQFLQKSVGRLWDDVYSEIRAQVDNRRATGFHVLQHVGWSVPNDVVMTTDGTLNRFRYGGNYEYGGLYVDDAGILRNNVRHKYIHAPAPVTSLHWYDNTWFKLEVLKRKAKCGCVHFKVPEQTPAQAVNKYRYYPVKLAVCIHGNEPVPQEIWYVVTYTYHDPDEVFKVYYWENEYDRARFGIKEGNVHKIYYRDVPSVLETPIVTRKKVANKKELKLLRKALEKGAFGTK